MTSRKLRWSAVAGVLLLAAAVALVWPRGDTSPTSGDSTPPESASSTLATAGGPGAGSGAAPSPEEPQPAVEQIPMPGCWDGLQEFDRSVSMDTFRAALLAAISNKDRYLAAYLQERLTELVGNDAGRALQVLEWSKGTSHPELGIYMEALKAAPAVHDPKVSGQLMKMGEDKGATLQARSAALDALETQKHLGAGDLKRLKNVALDETVDSVAWVATRTMGRVMKEDYERTGNYKPYWKELLDISGKSDDMAVRLLALEMPSYSNPLIEDDSFAELKRILSSDRERDVREMAAFRLGVTSSPDKALAIYKEAFDKEHDVCVRWAIFRFAVRVAGADALPLLAEFAAKDSRFTQDYTEFRDLYASGTVDFARIWLGKAEHHSCLVEEGAPH
ncbi:HEAT repeat domain-containing protein [Pyxidicoccus fallax]|uniref:HEAT repeat domain-containing protein n=1 Tax=Pyxidicoccus fallax TaxID=394095 RepID=A0A848LFJ0_9BACT|nr:HEAT repeat domain-containing protein [Pyxidicoccus fallax]NMO15813.1 HEAT repeat domain-containing protein [Pyxidicoccus fallax]NPC79402.1 HEAT repeat domain-containing protein [Pyxidicoccus fallax]